jgi:hypothetical protein
MEHSSLMAGRELGITLGLQVLVTRSRHTSAFVDCPHHQTLTTSAITARKNAFNIGTEITVRGVDVVALIRI